MNVRYLAPLDSSNMAIKDSHGHYAESCDFCIKVTNNTDAGKPLTATFIGLPTNHEGPEGEITFNIQFSEPVWVERGPPRAHLLKVKGGTVTSAWWLEGDTTNWEIVVNPAGTGPDGHRPCSAISVPCASGGRPVEETITATIEGSSDQANQRNERRSSEQPPEGNQQSNTAQKQETNEPATGSPSIQGTLQVGETLTANTKNVSDADGLTARVFTHQWRAAGFDVQGATGATYTLTASNEGEPSK